MNSFVRNVLLAVAWLGSVNAISSADEPVRKVLFIGIDGCRPDALAAAKTPHLDRLIDGGAFSTNTAILGPRKTGSDTVSGPGWSTIFTGVWADKHGVKDNQFEGKNYIRYPHLFSLLRQSRPEAVTASFCDWKPIAEQIVSDATVSSYPDQEPTNTAAWVTADEDLTASATKYLREANPDLVCVYLGQVDETGHAKGFHPSVPAYLDAIETVDGHIGALLAAVESRPSASGEHWLVVVTTDHVGQGTGHGGGHATEEIRRVFLIASSLGGEGVNDPGPARQTYLVDVVPTALAWLRIEMKPEWELDGTPFGIEAAVSQ